MAKGEDALDVLRSIDQSLKALLALAQARAPKPIASDRDLDGKYGNPLVKFMPRDWTGDSFKGARMSECPAALLELLAEAFDYFGREAEAKGELTDSGKAVAQYKYADAARARGWAKRIRDGRHVPQPVGHGANGHGQDAWANGDQDGF